MLCIPHCTLLDQFSTSMTTFHNRSTLRPRSAFAERPCMLFAFSSLSSAWNSSFTLSMWSLSRKLLLTGQRTRLSSSACSPTSTSTSFGSSSFFPGACSASGRWSMASIRPRTWSDVCLTIIPLYSSGAAGTGVSTDGSFVTFTCPLVAVLEVGPAQSEVLPTCLLYSRLLHCGTTLI